MQYLGTTPQHHLILHGGAGVGKGQALVKRYRELISEPFLLFSIQQLQRYGVILSIVPIWGLAEDANVMRKKRPA